LRPLSTISRKHCDTLLMIGTDFPYQQFFPKHATIIQIDLRGEQLGRRSTLDHGLVGDRGPRCKRSYQSELVALAKVNLFRQQL